jgi:hypothetical protein
MDSELPCRPMRRSRYSSVQVPLGCSLYVSSSQSVYVAVFPLAVSPEDKPIGRRAQQYSATYSSRAPPDKQRIPVRIAHHPYPGFPADRIGSILRSHLMRFTRK